MHWLHLLKSITGGDLVSRQKVPGSSAQSDPQAALGFERRALNLLEIFSDRELTKLYRSWSRSRTDDSYFHARYLESVFRLNQRLQSEETLAPGVLASLAAEAAKIHDDFFAATGPMHLLLDDTAALSDLFMSRNGRASLASKLKERTDIFRSWTAQVMDLVKIQELPAFHKSWYHTRAMILLHNRTHDAQDLGFRAESDGDSDFGQTITEPLTTSASDTESNSRMSSVFRSPAPQTKSGAMPARKKQADVSSSSSSESSSDTDEYDLPPPPLSALAARKGETRPRRRRAACTSQDSNSDCDLKPPPPMTSSDSDDLPPPPSRRKSSKAQARPEGKEGESRKPRKPSSRPRQSASVGASRRKKTPSETTTDPVQPTARKTKKKSSTKEKKKVSKSEPRKGKTKQ